RLPSNAAAPGTAGRPAFRQEVLMKHWLATTLVSGAVALASVPVLAQQMDAPPAATAQGAERKAARRLPSERMEARLAQLKSALKITPEQDPQWNAFADTLRKQARAADERIQARRAKVKDGKRAPMTAIERLERRKAFLAAAAARTDELLAAARPLY